MAGFVVMNARGEAIEVIPEIYMESTVESLQLSPSYGNPPKLASRTSNYNNIMKLTNFLRHPTLANMNTSR